MDTGKRHSTPRRGQHVNTGWHRDCARSSIVSKAGAFVITNGGASHGVVRVHAYVGADGRPSHISKIMSAH